MILMLNSEAEVMDKTECNTRKSYSLYKTLTSNPLPLPFYIGLANEYMQFLSEKAVEGEEITLPGRLGSVVVAGKKSKLKFDKKGVPLLPPDWVKTKALWERNEEAKATRKIVYHTNDNSSGVIYKFFWSKNRVALENKSLYSLRMTRTNKRTVSDLVKGGKEYFIKIRN